MNQHKHKQSTKNRRKALVKRILAWVSALSSVFMLVKLLLEIIQLIHH